MYYDLTKGKISRCLVLFVLPMIIGCLFLLYGYYRAIDQAQMSLILTIISLGTRVVLAYILSAYIGETGIWMSIPIGWGLADVTGIWYMKKAVRQKKNG